MAAKEIIDIVTDFIKTIRDNNIVVSKVLLYGSFAYGKPTLNSDIDVAIVSPDFGKDRHEEEKLLRQIAWRIDTRLEPVPISIESFLNDDWIPLIYEIKSKGILINIAA